MNKNGQDHVIKQGYLVKIYLKTWGTNEQEHVIQQGYWVRIYLKTLGFKREGACHPNRILSQDLSETLG